MAAEITVPSNQPYAVSVLKLRNVGQAALVVDEINFLPSSWASIPDLQLPLIIHAPEQSGSNAFLHHITSSLSCSSERSVTAHSFRRHVCCTGEGRPAGVEKELRVRFDVPEQFELRNGQNNPDESGLLDGHFESGTFVDYSLAGCC